MPIRRVPSVCTHVVMYKPLSSQQRACAHNVCACLCMTRVMLAVASRMQQLLSCSLELPNCLLCTPHLGPGLHLSPPVHATPPLSSARVAWPNRCVQMLSPVYALHWAVNGSNITFGLDADTGGARCRPSTPSRCCPAQSTQSAQCGAALPGWEHAERVGVCAGRRSAEHYYLRCSPVNAGSRQDDQAAAAVAAAVYVLLRPACACRLPRLVDSPVPQ